MADRFDVVVVELASGKVVSIIGTGLSQSQADRRVETGVIRYNIDRVFIADVPAGTYREGDQWQGRDKQEAEDGR